MKIIKHLNKKRVKLLRCPKSKEKLYIDRKNRQLNSSLEKRFYKINDEGIPLFLPNPKKKESKVQQAHYDKVSKSYCDNLTYPHTKEYLSFLDKELIKNINKKKLGKMAEICCGKGEGIWIFKEYYKEAVGVDISEAMVNEGVRSGIPEKAFLVQGDATNLPLQSNSFDSVVILGGIHHINNRNMLFFEVNRILRPGGILIFREPVDDFFIWRWIRAIIYRVSPALDFETEHPIRKKDTCTQLRRAGLKIVSWETHGFIGFCLFMNSDVLVLNKVFRFVPGIRAITKAFVFLDRKILKIPFFNNFGLQVIATVIKP